MASHHHQYQRRTQLHAVPRPSTQSHAQARPALRTTPIPNPSPEIDILMCDENNTAFWLDLNSGESSPFHDSSGTSFEDISGTVSSVGEKVDGSYVLVRDPEQNLGRYGDEIMELEVEDGSNGKFYSTPSEGDGEICPEGPNWRPASGKEEEVIGAGLRAQTALLHGLSTPYPQQVYNGYQASSNVSTSEEDNEYQRGDTMGRYTLSTSPQPGSIFSTETEHLVPRTHESYLNSGDSPWNPIEANRTPDNYEHGFVAFMPSPGPVGRQTPEEILQGSPSPVTKKRQSSKAKASQKGSRSCSHTSNPSVVNGKERCVAEAGWEHTIIQKDGIGRIGAKEEEQVERKRGLAKRKGKLAPEVRKKAKKMRQIKSCWRCWNLKIPCSPEEQCKACARRYGPSPTKDGLCCRTGFDEYESAFFPDFLNSHLKKSQVEDLISKNMTGFWDASLEVEVTTGALFKPMTLVANFFGPRGEDLLVHYHLVADGGHANSASSLTTLCSAPVGLMGVDRAELTERCKEHIEDMISNPEYPLQATAGDPTEVPYNILEIVRKYYIARKHPLVRKALMLHAINYSMSRLITFLPASGSAISAIINPSSTNPTSTSTSEPFLSSRLLNRQLKHALHKLHRELTTQVLSDLEKSMRSKSKDSWGPSLCAILILSLCIENLQIATDTFVVCDILRALDNANTYASRYSRRDSLAACDALEDYPYERCTRLFHEIYRSHKQATGKMKDGAFNPIQYPYEIDVSAGWDEATNTMALAVRDLIASSYDSELLFLAERPRFVDSYEEHANSMKVNNTGRLAAKFLVSFLGQ